MPRIARTPLSDLVLLQREVNQLFERLAGLDRAGRAPAGEWVPSVDVYECSGKLTIVVEVPGLVEDQLRVSIRDRNLVVYGERRERRPTGGVAAFLCMERPQGRFTRTIPMDMALDVQQAEARLAGGVLTVTIPRLKDRRGRERVIPVQVEEES
jgi:HSP20 family protein